MAQEYNAYTLINHLYFPEKIEDPDQVDEYGKDGRQRVLDRYVTGDYEILKNAVHIPDIITNINGNHEYKLLSSKDIDFENLYLPNSDINEVCWGTFPEDRRWPSGQSISVNEMYELMNVIDYLLCATKDLYNEITQLKYTGGQENMLWFVSRSISSNPKRYLQQKLTSNEIATGNPPFGLNKTILNPEQYQTFLNAKSEDNTSYTFGVASRFFENERVEEHTFTRIIKNLHSGKTLNGIEGLFDPQSVYMESQSNTLYNTAGGEQITIHGYLIGQDLKIYPGYNIFNFLYPDFDYALNLENFVDIDGKLLFTKTYFKYNSTTFKKVYIDFLENLDVTGLYKAGENFILYFIDYESGKEIKKIIYGSRPIYMNGEGTGVNRKPSIQEKYSTYKNYEYNAGYINEQYSEVDGVNVPFLYKIKDYNTIQISVSTPQTELFNTITATIDIKYYKNSNDLKINIYDLKNSNDVNNIEGKNEIKLSKEYLQDNVTLYNPSRYNIPEKNNILVNVEANVLKKDNITSLKLDDEYLDYPYYWEESTIDSDTNITNNYSKYYKYNGLDGNNKRIFTQFSSANEFKNFLKTNKFSSVENFSQVYEKINDPYSLSYNLTVSELLDQTYPFDKVQMMAKDIYDHYLRRENNNIVLTYTLPEDVEQIKLDLELTIEETSKTKEGYSKIPLNINKIHDLSINFNSPRLLFEEAEKFRNMYYNVSRTDNIAGNNLKYYTIEEWKNSSDNTINPGEYLTAFDLFTKYNNEYNDLKEHTNIVAYLNSDFNYNNPEGFGEFSQELIDTNLCYYDKRTYDNTIGNGNILNIQYDEIYNFVNLIGGKKLDYLFYVKNEQNRLIPSNANSYVLRNGTIENLNVDYSQIFSIHGLGFNYYCHGADSYAWAYKGNIGSTQIYNFNNAYISHSLLTPCDINDSNNILKFLSISLEQKDIENGNVVKDYLSYIQADNILPQNLANMSYYKNLNATEEENKYKYNGEFINTYYNIVTDDIIISKYSFTYNMLKESKPNDKSNKNHISYNIPSAYMKALNSTFYPSPNSYPPIHIEHIDEETTRINAYYDLNTQEDYERYVNYKNCWGSDTNGTDNDYYRPITLSMKILENHDNGIPFFNESNTAKLKFNIVRKKNQNSPPAFVGIPGKLSYICPNIRYYVSDFVAIDIPREGPTPDLTTYSGSYLYLDVNTFNIGGEDLNSPNHIIKYKEQLFNRNHEYTNGNIKYNNNFLTGEGITYPYPIPAIDINNNINNLWYDYDISRISDINKIKYTKTNEYGIRPVNKVEDVDHYYDHISWYIDCEISYLFIRNIPTGYDVDGFNCLLSSSKHYGSKNYKSTAPAASQGAQLLMNYISRTSDNSTNDGLNFRQISDGNGNTYDIFEYQTDFDNICINKNSIVNDKNVYYTLDKQLQDDMVRYSSDTAFIKYTNKNNIYRYYRTQVEAFLSRNLCSRSILTDNDDLQDISRNENR